MSYPPQQPASPPYVPPPAASPSRAKLWAAGAAVVSAIAGVATAVAAFSNGSPQPAAVPPPSSSSVGNQPPQSAAGDPTTPGPATGAGGAVAVKWSGKVVLGLEGIDLSQVPPGKGTDLGSRPAAGRNGSSSMEIKGTVALWENAGDPTPQGCKDLLATQSRNAIVVAEGDSVCLVNEKSPIGLLKVTSTHYNEGSYGLIEGHLTTWNLRATS